MMPLLQRLFGSVRRRLARRRRRRASVARIAAFRHHPKIVYALIPPARLANIGDHAQVVAIQAFLARHFPGIDILEIDKDEALDCVRELRRVVDARDLIVLHSGGNLGDRGMWSETGRRRIIAAFPEVPIVSLPQTIFFSDTPEGRRQQAITREIYGAHPRLTIVARDLESGTLAGALFPAATTLSAPDFALSLDYEPPERSRPAGLASARVLLCMRRDDESVFDDGQRAALRRLVPAETELYDTTLDAPIEPERRAALVRETLDYFSTFDAVVTDRYHGLIFAVLCRRPVVVLPTVDHKLVSACRWFEDIQAVRLVTSLSAVPGALQEALAAPFGKVTDWNHEFFDPLAARMAAMLGGQSRRS